MKLNKCMTHCLKVALLSTVSVSLCIYRVLSSQVSSGSLSVATEAFEQASVLHNGGEPYAISVDGKDLPLSMVDKYHIVLMYDDLQTTALCTIESLLRALIRGPSTHLNYAAHVHVVPPLPRRNISVVFVWMNDPKQQSKPFYKLRHMLLSRRGKRRIVLLQKKIIFNEAVANTPFEQFYNKTEEETLGTFREQNKGNAVRLALIQKYGGMYIDADMLVVNDPSGLNDGIARQSSQVFNNAAFKFHEAQHPFVKRLAQYFVKNYLGDVWGNQGPVLFTRVVRSFCEFHKPTYLCKIPERVGGESNIELTDWGIRRFYPLLWTAGEALQRDYDDVVKKYGLNMASERTSIMVHLWNHLWHRQSVAVENHLCKKGMAAYKNSFIGRLKLSNCPLITRHQLSPTGATSSAGESQWKCDKF